MMSTVCSNKIIIFTSTLSIAVVAVKHTCKFSVVVSAVRFVPSASGGELPAVDSGLAV